MAKTGKYFIFSLCLLLPTLFVGPTRADSTKVTATVDRNKISLGDTVTLTLSVSSAESISIGEPTLPNVPDLELLRKSEAMESRSQFINGSFQFVRTQKYLFQMRPLKQGNITIGSIDVVVNGKSIKTPPITIQVLGGGVRPPQADQNEEENTDPFDEADQLFNQLLQRRGMAPSAPTRPLNPNEAFSIQLELDKTQAYAGEQITATWFLVVPEGNQITNIDTLKYPTLKGFWKEDIQVATNLNFQSVVINGRPYRKALLVAYALFPIKEGTIEIDPYKSKCTVVQASAFGFGKPYEFTKASQPQKVRVLALPTAGKPSDFSGAVGDFSVKTELTAKQFPVNQPFSYKLKFEGSGNAKQIEKPSLNLPSTVELYDTKEEAKFFTTGKSQKEIEYLLIPREVGKLTLPAVSVSFFDTKKGQYVTKKSEPVSVEFVAGRAGDENKTNSLSLGNIGSGASTSATSAKVAAPKLSLPDVYLAWEASSSFTEHKWLVVWTMVYALIFIFLYWFARRELGFGKRQRSLRQKADVRFKLIGAKVDFGDFRHVGTEMTNLIYMVLGDLSNEGGANLEFDKLMGKLPPSVRREVEAPMRKILESAEALSFAPEGILGDLKSKEKMRDLSEQVKKVVSSAISLTESDEPSGESSKDPKAF